VNLLLILNWVIFLQRKFPDFSVVENNKMNLTEYLDCVIISHFHLDHCGALPYMTEMVGYNGPIYMTHPTKAICPILLVFKRVQNSYFVKIK
jgi:integrator complex subunit 11